MHVHANASSSLHRLDKSPAQQARSSYNLEPGNNFGRIVSQLARGIYEPSSSTDPAAAGADSGSGGTGSTTIEPSSGTDGTQSATSQEGSINPAPTTSIVDVSV